MSIVSIYSEFQHSQILSIKRSSIYLCLFNLFFSFLDKSYDKGPEKNSNFSLKSIWNSPCSVIKKWSLSSLNLTNISPSFSDLFAYKFFIISTMFYSLIIVKLNFSSKLRFLIQLKIFLRLKLIEGFLFFLVKFTIVLFIFWIFYWCYLDFNYYNFCSLVYDELRCLFSFCVLATWSIFY